MLNVPYSPLPARKARRLAAERLISANLWVDRWMGQGGSLRTGLGLGCHSQARREGCRLRLGNGLATC